MPRIKSTPLTVEVEIHPTASQEAELLAAIPKKPNSKKVTTKTIVATNITSDLSAPVDPLPKVKFKEVHIKDTFWLEKDVYQTIADLTKGKKNAKALIINKVLKDYLKKNKLAMQTFIEKK